MDIVFSNHDKSEIVSGSDFIDIKQSVDVINDRYNFVLRVEYSDKNWIKVRDSEYFRDNEVPEVLVKIDEIKVEDTKIVVFGFTPNELLI